MVTVQLSSIFNLPKCDRDQGFWSQTTTLTDLMICKSHSFKCLPAAGALSARASASGYGGIVKEKDV